MNAKKDNNGISTLIGVLDTDGATIQRVHVDASTHSLEVEANNTGTDNGPDRALHDQNSVTTLIGVSSADGVTPVAVYVDADGKLLIDQT